MAFFLTRIKNLSNIIRLREGGGIGRRVRLRGVWLSVWVQVPSFTPKIVLTLLCRDYFFVMLRK